MCPSFYHNFFFLSCSDSQYLGLDKSAGRVQILDGYLYYSPNCSRNVQLPPPHCTGSNPFSPPSEPNQKKNLWRLDTSVYEQPQWWCDCYGWIAFYNKNALDTRSTFLHILNVSTAQYAFQEDVGYTLPQRQADEWLSLDKKLESACVELICHYRFIPALYPARPWAFGYLYPHSKRGNLSRCLEKSRRWFGVWLGLLSYVIAEAESKEVELVNNPLLAKQNWKDMLVAKCSAVHIDLAWIDLLLDTSVASFAPYVWRTGTFLYITPGNHSERENRFQLRVEWFVRFGVPVWYRWDDHAASLPHNKYLAPLEYQLQAANSFIRKYPSLPTPINTDTPPEVTFVDDCVVDKSPSFSTFQMDTFFKLREERTAQLKENETSQQRNLRLSREGQPPTANARVFEWIPNGDGEFVHEEIIGKQRRREILEDYRGNQRRYNAVLNEWHLCVIWEQFEDSDNEDDDYFPSLYEGPPPESPKQMDPFANNSILDDVWTQGQDELGPGRAHQLQLEIIHVATLYFGYTPRIPLPVFATPILETDAKRKRFCHEFGLIWDQVVPVQEVLDYPATLAVIDFYHRLARNAKMLPDEWDLFQENHQSVVHSPRFKLFQPVFSTQTKKDSNGRELPPLTLYMLELGSAAIAPWKVAVKSASDALVICRLDPTFNEYHIIDFLLTNGIPFHTLQSSGTILRTPDIPRPCLTPLRSDEYTFGSQDYLAYREHCHTILNHPRGRAALMHGHFMWRIAFRSVLWEAVYRGLSGWSADIDEMVVVRDPYTNMEYIDDSLSTEEQEALCGTYHCLTGESYYINLEFY